MSCDICESEFCDGERCSENGDQDPYPLVDPDQGEDEDEEQEEEDEESDL